MITGLKWNDPIGGRDDEIAYTDQKITLALRLARQIAATEEETAMPGRRSHRNTQLAHAGDNTTWRPENDDEIQKRPRLR